jgi:ribonuclease Z
MQHGLFRVVPIHCEASVLSARFKHCGGLRWYSRLEDIPRYQLFPRKRKQRQSDHTTEISTSHAPLFLRPVPALCVRTREKYCHLDLGKEVELVEREARELPLWTRKMKSHVQLITSPTVDTPGTCMLLHFDSKRYLFGHVHEGLQRAMMQQKFGPNKLTEVFLTGQTGWGTMGGMIGMILSLADGVNHSIQANAAHDKETARRRVAHLQNPSLSAKTRQKVEKEYEAFKRVPQEAAKPRLTIHGGANLLHTLATGRKFMFRQSLSIYVNEYDNVVPNESKLSVPTWKDENIQVWAIPIRPVSDQSSPRDVSMPTRKRSYQEYLEPKSSIQSDGKASQQMPDEERLKILRSIVSDMFDSDWRLDALVEKRLGDVQMPAALFVRNSETHKIEKYSGPKPTEAGANADLTVLIRRPWPGALVAQLPPTQPSPVSICYVVRNHPQRGKFIAKKAKELNVEPGPNFGKLTAGESVLSRDGQTVTSDQVLEPGRAGAGFFLADVPSPDYIQDLITQPHWNSKDVMEGVAAVMWILGPGVSEDPAFKDFITKRNDLEHIITSPDNNANRVSMDSSASATIRHCQIDPARYSPPKHNNSSTPLSTEISATLADRGFTLHLEPLFRLDAEAIVKPLNTAKVIQETDPKVLKLGEAARASILSPDTIDEIAGQDLPSPDTQILTLGTGSALPSKYRNVSSTLVRVPGIGSYLLDCGENTLGQLSRIYGPEELTELLQDIKMIWISHLHADHHLGTASVIKAWNRANRNHTSSSDGNVNDPIATFFSKDAKPRKQLFIAAEPAMIDWIKEYSNVEDLDYENLVCLAVRGARRGAPDSTVLNWKGQALNFRDSSAVATRAMQQGMGLTSLAAAPVPHCHGAMAVSLTFPTGLKVSYSGDCRPSKDFVEIGKDTTILIHEATFGDDMRGDAIAKKHSTTSEAVGVGVAMGARRIILTHFSQRYQKIPSVDTLLGKNMKLESSVSQEDLPAGIEASDAASGGLDPSEETVKVAPVANKDVKVAVAFDYMRVELKDIASLERFNPAFIELYDNAAQ